jgi:heme ABC exporter ATP-binding subunit CcmA
MATATAVEVAALGRAYGERVVLREVSFTLPAGATVAVFGANGAGKTTLLRILAGLLRPHAGEVRVLGAALPEEAWRVRGRIGLLGHEPLLYRDLTVRENLRFHARLHDVPEERAAALVEQVGLRGRDDDPVRTLSRGMAQRAAIARALLHEPDVLLLDEPLSALDANLREEMRVEIKNIQRRIEIATVFVTHDQGEALAMSDHVVVMNKGKIEQIGAPREVYENPRSAFVASFLGNANFIQGVVHNTDNGRVQVSVAEHLLDATAERAVQPGESVTVVVRAEKIDLLPSDQGGLPGIVVDVDYLGAMARYQIALAGGARLLGLASLKDKPLAVGQAVSLQVDPRHCRIL